MSFTALVLAGSRPGADPLAAYAGVAEKALIVIDGETMLARVVAALRRAGAGRIVVAASSPAVVDHAFALGALAIPAGEGPSASVAIGLALVNTPLLVATADHPLLRPEWVTALIAGAPRDADVAVLLARREAVERDAPPSARTYIRLADGAFSGCNLFYLARPAAAGLVELWREVESDRKRPWRIVRRLGPLVLLRYLTRTLTLAAALDRLGALSGARIRVVESPSGLAAIDVDKPADLDLVRRLIEGDPPDPPSGAPGTAAQRL